MASGLETAGSPIISCECGAATEERANALESHSSSHEVRRWHDAFQPIQLIYIVCVTTVGLFIVYVRQRVPGMGGNDITYSLLVLCALCLFPKGTASAKGSKTAPGGSDNNRSASLPSSVQDSRVLSPAPSRLYYLDNLKVFMTFSVILHHITIGYGSAGGVDGFVIGNFHNWFSSASVVVLCVNQSYFMCAFFFISGYFTPSSLARKGVQEFVRDKFMRLGLPLFAFFLLFNGVVRWFAVVVVAEESMSGYWPVGLGPPWFLQVLLLFNFVFVFLIGVDGVPTVDCPTPRCILCLGAGVGLVQGFFMMLGFTLWGIPLAQGSLPFDILFFAGGCLAKKNQWLPKFQQTMLALSSPAVVLVHCVAFLCILMTALFGPAGPYHQCTTSEVPAEASPLTWSTVLSSLLVMGVMMGLMTVSVSMCVFRWFAVNANASSAATVFFSEAAYGVYIMHPLVWPVVSWTYVKILRTMGYTLSFALCDGLVTSSDDIGVGAVACGWLYTLTLSNFILWPLAFYVRKLPGLRNVL